MHRWIGDSYRSQVMEENQRNSFGVLSPNTQEPRELMVMSKSGSSEVGGVAAYLWEG